MTATIWEIAAEHVVTFAFGLLLGFVLSSRYRLVRRDGKEGDE